MDDTTDREKELLASVKKRGFFGPEDMGAFMDLMSGRDRLLTTDQAGRILGIKPKTLANWRHQRRGPKFASLLGRQVRYRRSDLDEWVEEQMVER